MNKHHIVQQLKQNSRLPVISAPMFLVSSAEMVIESCKQGVMGCFPNPNARTIADLDIKLKQITDSLAEFNEKGGEAAHWAMNMIVHESYDRFAQEIELVKKYRPKLLITALGNPKRVLETVHNYGGFVFADVNNVEYARRAVAAGVDGLILICCGAGGHTGSYSPFAFIEEVRQFFDGPVVLSGAISNARAIKATELLGADFAYMGTIFIASHESMVSDAYRDMVVSSKMEDIVQSKNISGANANWMIQSLQKAGLLDNTDNHQATPKIDFSGDMHEGSKAWKNVWSAGQSVGQIQHKQPIHTIIEKLWKDYQALEQS